MPNNRQKKRRSRPRKRGKRKRKKRRKRRKSIVRNTSIVREAEAAAALLNPGRLQEIEKEVKIIKRVRSTKKESDLDQRMLQTLSIDIANALLTIVRDLAPLIEYTNDTKKVSDLAQETEIIIIIITRTMIKKNPVFLRGIEKGHTVKKGTIGRDPAQHRKTQTNPARLSYHLERGNPKVSE